MELGHLAGQEGASIPQRCYDSLESGNQAVRRKVDHQGGFLVSQKFELLSLEGGSARKKAHKETTVSRKTRNRQGRHGSGGARYRINGDRLLPTSGNQAIPGIRNQRSAGV
jgi:hypothetical protein